MFLFFETSFIDCSTFQMSLYTRYQADKCTLCHEQMNTHWSNMFYGALTWRGIQTKRQSTQVYSDYGSVYAPQMAAAGLNVSDVSLSISLKCTEYYQKIVFNPVTVSDDTLQLHTYAVTLMHAWSYG